MGGHETKNRWPRGGQCHPTAPSSRHGCTAVPLGQGLVGQGRGKGGLQSEGVLRLGWPVVHGGLCVGHKAGGRRKWGDGG